MGVASVEKSDAFFMLIEMDETICHEAEAVLEALEIEMTTAIQYFLTEIVRQKKLPVYAKDTDTIMVPVQLFIPLKSLARF